MAVTRFNHGVAAQKLRRTGDANRNSIKRWRHEQSFRSGGADFKIAVDAASATLQTSMGVRSTSACLKAIIFLTDLPCWCVSHLGLRRRRV